jgi:hypothetical protein
MKNRALKWIARSVAVLAAATGLGGTTVAVAGDPPPPVHYSGLIDDYTPTPAGGVKNGPYEMHGKWSLEVDERHGTAKFSAVMNMETSDYGITVGSVKPDDLSTRGAHTHHILMTDGVVSTDWAAGCVSKFSPIVTGGFVVTGTAFVTGNGTSAPFGNPSPLTVCILGGDKVEFSNLTMAFGLPANAHFGPQAIHGVVVRCEGPWGFPSKDCALQE